MKRLTLLVSVLLVFPLSAHAQILPTDEPALRPGGVVSIGSPPTSDSLGQPASCTIGFFFKDQFGRPYLSTAGHCVTRSGARTQRSWRYGEGPAAYDHDGRKVGHAVWAKVDYSDSTLEDVRDFALVALDSGVDWNPSMAFFGGPTGYFTGTDPAVLHHYGWGVAAERCVTRLAISNPTKARTAATLGSANATRIIVYTHVYSGDSGSPVVDAAGAAVGNLVAGFGVDCFSGGVVNIVTRLSQSLRDAEAVLTEEFTLQRGGFALGVANLPAAPVVPANPGPLPFSPASPTEGADPGLVRPGSWIYNPRLNTFFTAGFLWRGSDGATYLSTAGHFGHVGHAAYNGWTGERIGIVVYRCYAGRTIGAADTSPTCDEGLIRLDRGVRYSPQMMHFGGPTYLRSARVAENELVYHYGQSPLGGLKGRSGIGSGQYESSNYELVRDHASGGDSGSPLMTADGGAIGPLHGFRVTVNPPAAVVMRQFVGKPYYEAALGVTLRLMTASICAITC